VPKSAENLKLKNPIELMQSLKVNPSPRNYELFYAYVQGVNEELDKVLHPLITGADAWSDSVADEIYTKYLADDRLTKLLDETTEEVGNELKAAMAILAQAGADAADYEKALIGAGGNLKNTSDPRSIREIVNHLVKATETMQNRSQTLEQKLIETNQQVEALKTNLDRVKIEAMTDALSGLSNRKRFDEVLADETEKALGSRKPLALVLCDIDHFKRFNDTWGHQTGDQIIRFVSGTLKRNIKDEHVCARYGGEEFAIIMPTTDMDTAVTVSEKIRVMIESKKLVRKSTNEDLGRVTISMGVAMFRETDEVEDIIERADKSLYLSKQNGRNRLTREDELETSAAA